MFKIKKINEKSAFTLAEIIITLSVVGIVAAYTIPTVVMNSQKQAYLTKFKKDYSTLQQFFKQYLADQGTFDLNNTHLYSYPGQFLSSSDRENEFDSLVHKYFKVKKACRLADSSCNITEKRLGNSDTSIVGNNGHYNFITIDGAYYSVYLIPGCLPDYTKIGSLKAYCGDVTIDTNGPAPPNTWGIDAWETIIIGHDGTLYPYLGVDWAKYQAGAGWETSGSYWTTTSLMCGSRGSGVVPDGTTGYGCAARILEESWEMNYNY